MQRFPCEAPPHAPAWHPSRARVLEKTLGSIILDVQRAQLRRTERRRRRWVLSSWLFRLWHMAGFDRHTCMAGGAWQEFRLGEGTIHLTTLSPGRRVATARSAPYARLVQTQCWCPRKDSRLPNPCGVRGLLFFNSVQFVCVRVCLECVYPCVWTSWLGRLGPVLGVVSGPLRSV